MNDPNSAESRKQWYLDWEKRLRDANVAQHWGEDLDGELYAYVDDDGNIVDI